MAEYFYAGFEVWRGILRNKLTGSVIFVVLLSLFWFHQCHTLSVQPNCNDKAVITRMPYNDLITYQKQASSVWVNASCCFKVCLFFLKDLTHITLDKFNLRINQFSKSFAINNLPIIYSKLNHIRWYEQSL